MLDKFLGISKCKKRELLSLLGHLNFASTVVVPGRSFISRLIEASKSVAKLHYYVHLNCETKKDIVMWHKLLTDWNGISIFIDPQSTIAPDMQLFTDASRFGYGGFFQGKWFAARWPDSLQIVFNIDISMTFCELYPIVVAAIVWGREWRGKRILFHCDNSGTVHAINKSRSKSSPVMSLMRRLVLVAAKFNFAYSSEHVPGVYNDTADTLSRFQMDRFRELALTAASQPTPIPPQVLFA
jgi:hypothetical protein